MLEEPSLPLLLGPLDAEDCLAVEEHRTTRRGRKRGYDSSTSSDPPLFSSDDLREASSDNYISLDRRKRHYKGTWWGAAATSSSAGIGTHAGGDKRALVRNIDSGVWLGSDGSDGSNVTTSAYPASEANSERDFDMEEHEHGKAASASYEGVAPTGRASEVVASTGLEDLVANRIQDCLDEELEIVDLAGLGLIDLSNETLRPLRYMTKSTIWREQPPSQAYYNAFTPSLKIFLSNNFLRTAPLELFHLHTLTVLSLRGNELTEVPPAIGKLENLVELNLSCNRLRWLPWELLRLWGNKGKLLRLNVLPNPFFRPVPPNHAANTTSLPASAVDSLRSPALQAPDGLTIKPASDDDATYAYMVWRARVMRIFADKANPWLSEVQNSVSNGFGASQHSEIGSPFTLNRDPTYLGHTPVGFFQINGTKARHSPAPPTLLPHNQLVLPPLFHKQSSTSNHLTSRAPSLLELALQSCCASPYVTQVRNYIGSDIPEALRGILQEAESLKAYGKNLCSVCGREYIIPRSEWIEYWHYEPYENITLEDDMVIPVLRRGCSWRCVPDPRADEGLVA